MNKHATINDLLEVIRAKTALDESCLVDYWDADLCAVGIKWGDRLMYVSTFNHVNAATPMYDYEISLLDPTGIEVRSLVEMKTAEQAEVVAAAIGILE